MKCKCKCEFECKCKCKLGGSVTSMSNELRNTNEGGEEPPYIYKCELYLLQ